MKFYNLVLLLSPFHFFSVKGCLLILLLTMTVVVSNSFKMCLNDKNVFSMMILVIFILNVISLLPYMYCFSSYLWGNLNLSLFMFTSIIIFSLILNLNKYLSHFLPSNSPFLLWDVLIILEFVSMILRPFTLSLRLSCNMLTGHVLMALVMQSNLTIVLTILMFFELMISIIQSHVYSLLVNSYLK